LPFAPERHSLLHLMARSSPLKPRKAPRQPRSESTVAALLEAAAQVLERKGLEGFNTNAVARRAGVSIGSLYQYFPGKDALVLALIRREGEHFLAEAAAALEQPNGADALIAFIGACVRQQVLRPTLAHLLDVEEGRPGLREAAGGGTELRAFLREILARDDLPHQPKRDVAAYDLLALVRGMTDAAGERGETDVVDLQRRIEAAVFGYLRGMAAGSG
jgi:AcrR family transcriptional regulator